MSEERRNEILRILRDDHHSVTGSELATRLKVSRQVIVQDVAILRASGAEIVATPQGYVLPPQHESTTCTAVLACQHTREQTEDELTLMVDVGLRVIDVIVEHPLYGELKGLLMLDSREDVRAFICKMEETSAGLLSALTNGVHLHTVEAARPSTIQRAREELQKKGYLLCQAAGSP
ncbi:MAG: transcription repressor NadR [Chloroflexi bacterium]|nr:transcription repressor NadR [Chloroflexota bacterium]